MKSTRLLGLASVVAAVSLAPTLVSAQLEGRFVLTPYVGAYLPTSEVVEFTVARGGTTVSGNGKHASALATGANASYWLTDHFAIEAGAVYSHSNFKGDVPINAIGDPSGASDRNRAHVLAGSAKLMVQLLSPESAMNMRFGVGPALITRGGTAYESTAAGKVTGLTDIGAAVSLCTRIPLTNRIGVRLRGEDYIYQTTLGWTSYVGDVPTRLFNARTQHDFVLSAGLQVSVNR